jgi:hypothetical protein
MDLDAGMAHFLEALLLSLSPPRVWLVGAQDTPRPKEQAATPRPGTLHLRRTVASSATKWSGLGL